MKFSPPLRRGVLVRRYKRFLVDVRLAGSRVVTMHCPNTGAMTGCAEPGSEAWFSTHDDPRRKYRHTLELVRSASGEWIGVHSARANGLVAEALAAGVVSELCGWSHVREVRLPSGRGRFDFGLSGPAAEPGFLEVKSVTLAQGGGWGAFPDARSARALRHVTGLATVRRQGTRAVLLFCVQHSGIERVRPADEIDPAYGAALREARDAGVEVLAYRARMNAREVRLAEAVPVVL